MQGNKRYGYEQVKVKCSRCDGTGLEPAYNTNKEKKDFLPDGQSHHG